MRIELKCKCGSSAVFSDEHGGGTYINNGGEPDEKGRRFIVGKRADEWLERHQQCLDEFGKE